MQHPPGAVCVIHSGANVFELTQWAWTVAMHDLVPRGTSLVGIRGSAVALQRNMAIRAALDEAESRARQMNAAVRDVLQQKPDLGWVCFIDTDEDIPFNAVKALLDSGRPLVSGVVLQRFFPYDTCAFASTDPVVRIKHDEVPKQGAMKVAACGTGCLLIRREVIDAVGDPWFATGQINPELLQEDIYFTMHAAEAGYPAELLGELRILHKTEGWIYLGMDGRPWMRPLTADHDVRFPINIKRG